ncbi:MAG: penicillin acylase family protein, partial [Alphaproteobacteria bacterium]|nr:penicillin acylase family protein [Alphaproteobacteria bacterium]
RTKPKETCKDRLALAHRSAVAFLQNRYGSETPPWGEAHRARFSHPVAGRIPLLGSLLNREIATSGGPTTVNRGGSRFRDERDPFRHAHGAGYRAIYDLEDLDRSRFIQAVGQSGNPFSPHYDDLVELWRDGAYISHDQARTPVHSLLLRPE